MSKTPGRNVKETERNTVAVKLRLTPEAAEDVKAIAEEMGLSMSDLMTRVIGLLGGQGSEELLNEIQTNLAEERDA